MTELDISELISTDLLVHWTAYGQGGEIILGVALRYAHSINPTINALEQMSWEARVKLLLP